MKAYVVIAFVAGVFVATALPAAAQMAFVIASQARSDATRALQDIVNLEKRVVETEKRLGKLELQDKEWK